MSFASFKSRVRESALKAAEAARNVTAFDQMAAQDEYIHSEGLNLSKNKKKNKGTAAQKLNELIPTDHELVQSQPFPGKVVKHQATLLPIVADAMKDKQRREELPKEHHSDGSEDEDEDDDDHIMSMIRRPLVPRVPQHNRPKPLQKIQQAIVIPMETESAPQKKDPLRFMSDLDDRMSKVEKAEPRLVPQHRPAPAAPLQQSHRWNLLQNVAATSLGQYLPQGLLQSNESEEEGKPTKGPLVPRRDSTGTKKTHVNEEDDIQVVVSSSVLGAAEAAELERMRLVTQKSTDPLTIISHLIMDNPHNTFIAFTLVLGSMVYFYSRHRGTEDDVT